MLERTLIFVDTSYLLASFYNSWETGARAQLEIDLPDVVAVLANMAENQLHQPVHRQLWYDGIPDSGPHRYQRALRTCDGVQLRAGQLIEWGERRTQKAVDTRLVADMVLTAVDRQVSDIILVSGDADMIPGVSEASNRGVRVHLYGFGWDSMSSALRHHCDSTTILDPREDFGDSMRLEVLEGPIPPVVREKPIGDAEPPEDPGPSPIPEDATRGDQPPSTSPERPEAPATPTAADQAHQAEADAPSSEEPATPAGGSAGATASTEATASPSAMPRASETQAPGGATDDVAAGVSDARAMDEAAGMPTHQPSDGGNDRDPAAHSSGEHHGAHEAQSTPSAPESAPATGDGEVTPGEHAEGSQSGSRKPRPNPSMMAPKRRLRSRYVPLPNEVWASAGFQTPFDVGQQYATWWYDNAATAEQRDQAHLLSGGGLPPEVDRPLLQFACETLHEYTLSESQRVNLRDGFHAGIRGVLINVRRD